MRPLTPRDSRESDRMLKEFDRGTCMGVPLTYLRETIGEVFVTRPHGRAGIHYR